MWVLFFIFLFSFNFHAYFLVAKQTHTHKKNFNTDNQMTNNSLNILIMEQFKKKNKIKIHKKNNLNKKIKYAMNFYFSKIEKKYLTFLFQEIGRCQEMTLCEGFVSFI